jgi:prepilin-type N-terminal cleavage/methylation domain-containing protein
MGSLDDEVAVTRRRGAESLDDDGFGLIEVVLALTVLAIAFVSVGWLVVSTYSSAQLAKQRTTAAGIAQLIDTQLQNTVPTETTLTSAEAYVTSLAGGKTIVNDPNAQSTTYTVGTSYTPVASSTLLTVVITVSWKPAVSTATTETLSNTVQVGYQ